MPFDSKSPQPDRLDQMIGRKFGGYTITRCVGKGGMGVVYEAKHQGMSQRAAVKVLNQTLSAESKVLQRFFNEAKALSMVQHPCVVKVFEFGQLDDGTAFIMMEFLDGEPLSHYIALAQRDAQALPLALAVELGTQMAAALASSHAKGVVHRDLKPENVFLVPDALVPSGLRVKVFDFGIAKFLEGESRKTTVGMILGTPLYMSPEQCEGNQELDAKVDVYALGVMLYEMVAGHLPFVGDTNAAIMRQHLVKEPPALAAQRTELPVALTELVHRMLAKQPSERPTMTEVFAAMSALLPDAEKELSGLRKELALHLVSHQHTVGAGKVAIDPLAPTLGNTPQADSVTPFVLNKPTPITVTRNSRMPLILGGLLALTLVVVVALVAWLPSHSASRGSKGAIATTPVAVPAAVPVPVAVPSPAAAAVPAPAATGATAVAHPASVLDATPPPDRAPTEPAADPATPLPAQRPNHTKVAKPRPGRTKPATAGKPARIDDDQPWR